jgi:hypothetical protein
MVENQRVGRWTLQKKVNERWLCVCDCGSTRHVLEGNLRKGRSKSCGCQREKLHCRIMALAFGGAPYGIR